MKNKNKLKKKYPIGFDAEGDLGMDYGITGVPETLFIDSKRTIVHKQVGPLEQDMIIDKLNLIINEKLSSL